MWLWVASFMAMCTSLCAQDKIAGFWKRYNEETGKRQCIIAIYPYQDKYYGRIIATFNSEGKLNDSIESPVNHAPGVKGKPFYCGLDLVWNLVSKGKSARFEGKIVDPRKGKVYDASVWRDHKDLIIRGKLLFMGKNTIWVPAEEADLPPGFKKESIANFVPKIPKV